MNPEVFREMALLEGHHWWFTSRRLIIESIISSLRLPDGADILEIGSGTGGNLQMLSRYGNTHAIELDEYARDYATKKSGINVVSGYLPDGIPFKPSTFDLVCLFDVLEHVEDDVGSLNAIQTLLKPGGKAFLTVPAYQWLWSMHDERHQHKRRYTISALKYCVTKSGLNAVRYSHFNSILFPIAVIARILDKFSRRNESIGSTTPQPWLNSLLRSVFSFEATLLRIVRIPFGVSILAVVEKK